MLQVELLEDRRVPSVVLTGETYQWSNQTGDWTDSQGQVVGNWGITNWHFQRADDFDGDGVEEFVARETAGRFWMLDFDPVTGQASNVALAHWGGGMSWDYHAWVDVDQDGVDEVIGKTGGTWWMAADGVRRNVFLDSYVGSDAQLAAFIRSEIPGLDQMDYLDKARALLNWSSSTFNYARSSPIAAASGVSLGSNLPLWQIYNDNLTGGVGYFCGGYANLNMRVMHLFGIDAFTVDFGDSFNFLTHTTTIVPVWQRGQWNYYLFDPTFNLTFRDAAGDYATISDAFAGDVLWETKNVGARRSVGPAGVFFDPAYSVETYKFWHGHLYEARGYDVDNFVVELLRQRIFHVSASLSPTAATGFTARLAKLIALDGD